MSDTHEIEREIRTAITERAGEDAGFAIAWAILQLADAQQAVADGLPHVAPSALRWLEETRAELKKLQGGAS
jgi:hypothetical protein